MDCIYDLHSQMQYYCNIVIMLIVIMLTVSMLYVIDY